MGSPNPSNPPARRGRTNPNPMQKHHLITLFSFFLTISTASASPKLTGTPIGTVEGFDYATWQVVDNIQSRAFDGNLNTAFATNERSYTWVGLDLGEPHIITKVGWAPRQEDLGLARVNLGIFQGANSPDFMDAVPIYMVKENGKLGEISYADVNCSRGFRYVRWVSTSDARCNIAELEFYGEPGVGDDSRMYQLTNLPTVCINTEDCIIPFDKETDIESNVIIIADGKVNVSATGGVRERGNGSRTFPKKPWRIKFDKKQKVLNAPAKAKKWTLINNYGDKTLMRNIVAFEIARRVGMDYVPFCQPVDVIMNGEYKGCYQLCDQVEVNPGRVELTEMTPEDIEGEALTGGYLIEIDAYADQEPEQSWFKSTRAIPVTIKSPKDDEIQPVQKDYIKNYFQQWETGVYAADYKTENPGYFSIFDIDSFLQYFIVSELTGNTDSFWSTYMHKDRGESKFYTGPVWDVDLGFENDTRTYPIAQTSANNFLSLTWNSSVAGNMRSMVRRIVVDNPYNRERLAKAWSIARDTKDLQANTLNAFIDRWAETLDESQTLNFRRWPILSECVHQNPVALGSYEAEVARLKAYLTARLDQLDGAQLMGYDAKYAEMTGVADTYTGVEYRVEGRTITASGDASFKVLTPSGLTLFTGRGTTPELPSGLYIVVTDGGCPAKLLLR